MKKLILVAFLLVGLTSFAQENEGKSERTARLSPEQKEAFLLKKLTKELDLNADQQVKIQAIIAAESNKKRELMALRRSKMESGQQPTAQEKTDMKKVLQTAKAEMDTKLKTILTSDQYIKWQKIKEDRKSKMKARMKEKIEEKM